MHCNVVELQCCRLRSCHKVRVVLVTELLDVLRVEVSQVAVMRLLLAELHQQRDERHQGPHDGDNEGAEERLLQIIRSLLEVGRL